MALSRSSVLHYWSSRYGINPRVGGRPVFTRNSAGAFVTQEGEVDSAIINTPRFDWATLNLPNGLTERRKLLTLELARSNLNTLSLAAWTPDGASITAGQPDPASGTSGAKITHTGGNARTYAGATFGSNGTKAIAIAICAGNAATSSVKLFDVTAAVVRCQMTVTWTAGVPSAVVVVGAGTIFPIQPIEGGYYILAFAPTGVVSANVNRLEIAPDGSSTGKFIFAYRPNFEDGPFSTSFLDPSATRATDTAYWNYPPVPQASMVYLRHVEQGTIFGSATATALWEISSAANANARLLLYPSSGLYLLQYSGAAGGLTQSPAGALVAPAVGDTVETVGILYSDGSVELVQSINAAAAISSGRTAANPDGIAAAWSDTRLWLNSLGTVVGSWGCSKFAEIKIVKFADVVAPTAQGRLTELQGFELGPNGDVL